MTAAELHRLQATHCRFEHQLIQLERMLETGKADREQLLDAVRGVREELAARFTLLDQEGERSEVELHAPHFWKRVRKFQDAESPLLGLVEQLERSLSHCHPTCPEGTATLTRQVVARIRAHESQRNRLVFDAFNGDLAAGD
jgi:hypothetical protein